MKWSRQGLRIQQLLGSTSSKDVFDYSRPDRLGHEANKMRPSAATISAVTAFAGFTTASSVSFGSDEGWSPMFSRQEMSSSAWPYGPFSTKGRDIINSKGEAVTWAGVNWPGSGETMVPEGLEFSSVGDILDLVKSVGFNFIRLTYAIEMVDQIYERNGSDVGLEIAMINALGYENGTKVTKEMVAKNPGWSKDTTRFEVWDKIAEEAAKREIYIHPDVHVGKAQWCCNKTDGNAWFDDYNFPVKKWHRGLQHTAEWAKKHPNVVSMSLRNELRRNINMTDPTINYGYDWVNLVGNNTEATNAIYQTNPDILVSWSGMQFDQDLSALTSGLDLNTAPCYKCDAIRDRYTRDPLIFDLDSHPWADKVFYELHLYSMSEDQDTDNCPIIEAELYQNGYNALGIDPPAACNITGACMKAVRETPVIMSEFGWAQDETLFNDTLQGCIRNFTTQHNISWAMWSLAGSYRIRSGGQGVSDTWALSNYDWDGWQFPEGIEKWWKPWVAAMFGS
ncbi:Glycosyl hydrolase 5 family protein [Pseudocercospora fuligena]|uniref:Glycosyl hydrolase 5 family protein n=1 Tax=Pseudocercospora fuligena TaxID=685502 RepID=A0A8H6VJN3_9PEZI|nr:Glycosyl hydrolase 5 family protein [Pseudocercospora fuligena]